MHSLQVHGRQDSWPMLREGTADVPDCRTRPGRGGTSGVDDDAVKFLVLAGQLGQQPLDSVQKEQALKVAEEPRFTPQVEQCLKIQVNPRADCRSDDAIALEDSSASFSGRSGIPVAANCSAMLNDARIVSSSSSSGKQSRIVPRRGEGCLFSKANCNSARDAWRSSSRRFNVCK